MSSDPTSESTYTAHSVHTPTILIIDDDPDNQALLEMTLRANHLGCIAVESIEEGWQAIQQGIISLVVSDLDVDALTLIERMRADPLTASIPVIIASGEPRVERLQAAIDAGASSRYFTKPFAYVDLVSHVRQCLANKSA
jgi:DNA-binding NtrC family response regulator